jgi:uncharacterized membrane protein YbhN (UPF0104 family)
MSHDKLVPGIKVAVLGVVLAAVGWHLNSAWSEVKLVQLADAVRIDWRWSVVSMLGFAGELWIAAAIWIRLQKRMEPSGTRLQLYGAYFFSQLGKYIPGKVVLLLMRLERTVRLGASSRSVTISTLMENAAYMVSGGALGILVLQQFVGRADAAYKNLLLVSALSIAAMLAAMHPAVFYRFVNLLLRRMGRPEVDTGRRLPASAIMLSILLMIPCWLFGGLAAWASARCLVPVGVGQFWSLTGAFSISVLAGMISLLPGGLGIREAVQGILVYPVVMSALPAAGGLPAEAKIIVAMMVMLQRLFQIAVEVGLGLTGGFLTRSLPVNNKNSANESDPDTASAGITARPSATR